MSGTCPHGGAPLDEHERDLQFRLPRAVLDLPDREETEGTWMTAPDVEQSVLLEVPGAGSFVRSLLPIRLTGGYQVTFGVWLAIAPEVLDHASAVWREPEYAALVLDGHLANDLPVWGLLGVPATATVPNFDTEPVVTATTDPTLHGLLPRSQ